MFSQFKLMLNVLEDFLLIHRIKYLRLDGDTPSSMRQRLIDSFNAEDSEFKIFLLSTKAGGVGINLTNSDTVFMID